MEKMKDENQLEALKEKEDNDAISMLTDEQKEFVLSRTKKSVILSSCAGSGKTHCCVLRLKELIKRGVDPKKIIFFSFTKTAVDELKERVGRDDIKITTIHSYCFWMIRRMGKFKTITNFYEFIDWYKKENRPKRDSIDKVKLDFEKKVSNLYDDAEVIDSNIASFKLQAADGIKGRMPDYFLQYSKYLKEEKKRDFSDMLIDVRNLLKDNKWLKMFKDKYDYIFLDEYQDTSSIQMEILMRLNAKSYYLVGDVNQSIYGYTGSSCDKIENMLSARRKVETMTLSTNFRSGKLIVENSNKFSNLDAIPFNDFDGKVEDVLISFKQLTDLISNNNEVVVLGRTNFIVKLIEYRFLKEKIPMNYFNYLKPKDIEDIKADKISNLVRNRLEKVLKVFPGTKDDLIKFIEDNRNSKNYTTTIHKMKGKEHDTCVVVNSISEEVLEKNKITLPKEKKEYYTFFPGMKNYFEEKNIHYVSVSRAKRELYYMLIQL